MKKFIIILILVLFSITGNLFSQKDETNLVSDKHKYVTYQGWELIRSIHPEVTYTPMHNAMKNPSNGNYGDYYSAEYDGTGPWEKGTILTGSYREDKEDPVYCYCGTLDCDLTRPHFWNADVGDVNRGYSSDSYIWQGANEKMKAYWTSNIPGYDGKGLSIGPIRKGDLDYSVSIRYNNLAQVYQDPWFVVVDYERPYTRCGETGWGGINGSIPLVQYLTLWCGKTEQEAFIIIRKIVWEIVGRMCHLIQDMGVPAHVHDDPHPSLIDADYYEYDYLNVQGHYLDKTYADAITQGAFYNEEPIININNLQNPIRTITYLANQLSDRFPSDNGDADISFTQNSNTDDATFIYNQLHPKYEFLSQIPTQHFGNNPPYGLMELILNQNYVYSIRATAGFLWYVYNQFGIISTPPPIISSISQSPAPLTLGNSTTFTCNLTAGSGPSTYSWSMTNTTDYNITYTPPAPTSNHFTIYWNPTDISSKVKVPDKSIKISCTASNDFGNSTKIVKAYYYANSIGGCPWLVVTDQDTNFHFDNNLLNKSQLPENQGSFITDKYILKTKPGIFDNKIKLDIVETSIDSTIINNIKLYAVTHPIGTKLGILSNNTIVMYDSATVKENTNASLFDPENNYTNITNNIHFHNHDKINNNTTGDSLYHIYAEYLRNTISNPGIITYMERDLTRVPINPWVKDSYSGNLFINTSTGTSQIPFMRRENLDDVIIPVNPGGRQGSVDSIHIAWDKSFKIQYAAIASLSYSGFTIIEWPLVTAFHTNDGDVLQNLLYLDSGYTYVSPNAYLNLEFSPPANKGPSNDIKEYIIEINGQVIFLGSNKMKTNKVTKPDRNTIPDQYSLSQNYPNPFNPVTKINFAIPKQGFVTLKIYDVLGREVRTLVNEVKSAGQFLVDFNASEFSSGVYFYRLESEGFSDIKRMMLIK